MASLIRDTLLALVLILLTELFVVTGRVFVQDVGAVEAGQNIGSLGYLLLMVTPLSMAALFSALESEWEYSALVIYGATALYYLRFSLLFNGPSWLPARSILIIKWMALGVLLSSLFAAVLSVPRVSDSIERRLELTEVFN